MQATKLFSPSHATINLVIYQLYFCSQMSAMVASESEKSLIHSIRLSSVGPGTATAADVVHEPKGMDLAMKLHYVIGVYAFKRHAVEGLTTTRIKESMFYLLSDYYRACGRFRRWESGRPYLKCNDCGARFVEAECDSTVEDLLLEMSPSHLPQLLVYHQPLGPDLSFSPPIYLQVTWFKCGGMSLGFSWAHVLGDAFSASDFINKWGQLLSTIQAHGPPSLTKSPSPSHTTVEKSTTSLLQIVEPKDPISIKRVEPVGDHWVTANNFQMATFSFHLTATQISHLQSRINPQHQIPTFESLCAIIWQSIAKIKDGFGSNTVTFCKRGSHNCKIGNMSNSQTLRAFEADFSIVEADLDKLAKVISDESVVDERSLIEETIEKENGVSDFVVYGANLTFVNWEEANLDGLELNGRKADFAYHSIQGVGDEGVVLVLQGPKDSKHGGCRGRLVTIILPEELMLKLKPELKNNGLLFETNL